MTKIYEALENAGRERLATDTERTVKPPVSTTRLPKSLEEKLITLYQRIEVLLEGRECRIVEFAGIQVGEESSRLCGEFARLMAARIRHKVLLLAPYPTPYPGKILAGVANEGWEDVISGQRSIDDAIHQVGDSRLWVSQMSVSDTSLVSVLGSEELDKIFDALRQRFELVIIDSPPVSTSADASLLSTVSDGVVLIVEAGRTRWQVIKDGMEQIVNQRGAILGVILNRRRHYIPDFVYRRL